ncbi:MAG: primosomal protein N', partial [Oscillospiraceae bacterium]|nr:primosomal protein N' [Oscillospiraceae bacterium]
NYPDFYEEEIRLRESMLYPPFCDVVVVGFSSLMDKECGEAARKFAGMLVKNAAPYGGRLPLRILGPAPNAIGRINGRYRYRLMIKCRNSKPLRELIEVTLKQAYNDSAFHNVSFYADMNGGLD